MPCFNILPRHFPAKIYKQSRKTSLRLAGMSTNIRKNLDEHDPARSLVTYGLFNEISDLGMCSMLRVNRFRCNHCLSKAYLRV